MGVLGLFAALVRYLAAVSVRWSLPPSSRISIDGSPAIHMALHENYAACVKDGDYSGFYKTFVRHLRHAKEWAAATAKITVVFDGPRSDSKRVNMERAARAKSATRKAAARSSGRRTRAAAAAAPLLGSGPAPPPGTNPVGAIGGGVDSSAIAAWAAAVTAERAARRASRRLSLVGRALSELESRRTGLPAVRPRSVRTVLLPRGGLTGV